MLVTKEGYALSYKHNFKNWAVQVQAQFRLAFPQRPPPSKIAIQKNVLNYQKDDTCLNLNNTRSGTMITVRTEDDDITVVQQSLEMMKVECKRNGGCILENLKDLKVLAISAEFEQGTNILHAQQVLNALRHKADDILV